MCMEWNENAPNPSCETKTKDLAQRSLRFPEALAGGKTRGGNTISPVHISLLTARRNFPCGYRRRQVGCNAKYLDERKETSWRVNISDDDRTKTKMYDRLFSCFQRLKRSTRLRHGRSQTRWKASKSRTSTEGDGTCVAADGGPLAGDGQGTTAHSPRDEVPRVATWDSLSRPGTSRKGGVHVICYIVI